MKTYRLIRHETLGNGVVLREDTDGVGTVCFEGRTGVKNILLSHPAVHPGNITIRDFARKGLHECLFDDAAKLRGHSYANPACISQLKTESREFTGVIKGTYDYPFSIRIDDKSNIVFHCTCPVNGMCKHLYAAMEYLSQGEESQDGTISFRRGNQSGVASPYHSLIETFLFNKDGNDIVSLMSIVTICRDTGNAAGLLKELSFYYGRPQYRHRICCELLPLLFYEQAFRDQSLNMTDIPDTMREMIAEADAVFSDEFAIIRRKDAPGKFRYLASAVIRHDLDGLLKFIDDDFSYIYRTMIADAFSEYLKTYSLTVDDIIRIRGIYQFGNLESMVRGRVMNLLTPDNAMVYLLFIDAVPFSAKYAMELSTDTLVRTGAALGMCSSYYRIMNQRIREIDADYYPEIIENIIRVCVDHGVTDSEDYMHINGILNALPDTKYVKMVLESHYRQRRKTLW